MSFKVGQKVVCVEGHCWPNLKPLIKGEIYTVEGVHTCLRCGSVAISVGIYNPFGATTCSCNASRGGPYWWLRATRFRPLDYSFGEKVTESITEIVEKEIKTEKVIV